MRSASLTGRTFFVPPPQTVSAQHPSQPVFFSYPSSRDTKAPKPAYDCLPCVHLTDSDASCPFSPDVRISPACLQILPSGALVICLLIDNPPKIPLQLEVLGSSCSIVACANSNDSSTSYLLAYIGAPTSCADIFLRIRAADWFIHLPLPVNLDTDQSVMMTNAVDHLHRPWVVQESLRDCDKTFDVLRKVLRCEIGRGHWIDITRGLFIGCRVKLEATPGGTLRLEALLA